MTKTEQARLDGAHRSRKDTRAYLRREMAKHAPGGSAHTALADALKFVLGQARRFNRRAGGLGR